MDDLEVKNDKRRLIITSTEIIIILLVGFGVLRLFYYEPLKQSVVEVE